MARPPSEIFRNMFGEHDCKYYKIQNSYFIKWYNDCVCVNMYACMAALRLLVCVSVYMWGYVFVQSVCHIQVVNASVCG